MTSSSLSVGVDADEILGDSENGEDSYAAAAMVQAALNAMAYFSPVARPLDLPPTELKPTSPIAAAMVVQVGPPHIPFLSCARAPVSVKTRQPLCCCASGSSMNTLSTAEDPCGAGCYSQAGRERLEPHPGSHAAAHHCQPRAAAAERWREPGQLHPRVGHLHTPAGLQCIHTQRPTPTAVAGTRTLNFTESMRQHRGFRPHLHGLGLGRRGVPMYTQHKHDKCADFLCRQQSTVPGRGWAGGGTCCRQSPCQPGQRPGKRPTSWHPATRTSRSARSCPRRGAGRGATPSAASRWLPWRRRGATPPLWRPPPDPQVAPEPVACVLLASRLLRLAAHC